MIFRLDCDEQFVVSWKGWCPHIFLIFSYIAYIVILCRLFRIGTDMKGHGMSFTSRPPIYHWWYQKIGQIPIYYWWYQKVGQSPIYHGWKLVKQCRQCRAVSLGNDGCLFMLSFLYHAFFSFHNDWYSFHVSISHHSQKVYSES